MNATCLAVGLSASSSARYSMYPKLSRHEKRLFLVPSHTRFAFHTTYPASIRETEAASGSPPITTSVSSRWSPLSRHDQMPASLAFVQIPRGLHVALVRKTGVAGAVTSSLLRGSSFLSF